MLETKTRSSGSAGLSGTMSAGCVSPAGRNALVSAAGRSSAGVAVTETMPMGASASIFDCATASNDADRTIDIQSKSHRTISPRCLFVFICAPHRRRAIDH
jgi:hypothetical protein